MNGLRGLCRPLPPHSFLLLLLFLFLSRVSFSFSFALARTSCSCRAPSLFLHAQPLSLFLFRSLTLCHSSFFYFQIRISVIRAASLDKTLFIDASPRVAPCSSFPSPCLVVYGIYVYVRVPWICVCVRSLMRFHLKSRRCHARLSTRISYRRIRDNGLEGKTAEYIDGTKWRVGEKKRRREIRGLFLSLIKVGRTFPRDTVVEMSRRRKVQDKRWTRWIND